MAICRCGLSPAVSLPLFSQRKKTIVSAVAVLLLAPAGLAQQSSPASSAPANSPPSSTRERPGPDDRSITIPAATRLALVLTHPVDTKTTHRGDVIYAQTTAPVTSGGQLAIPAGTFVQGQVERLARHGSQGEFLMQSLSVIFPDGYVAHIDGPISMESDEGTAWRDPSGGAKAGAIAAPIAGLGLGALIGSAAHTTQSSSLGGTTISSSTPTGLAIGSVVGLAAGGVISLVLLTHSSGFYVDVGSPMEMILPHALTLAENRPSKAGREAQPSPPIVPVARRPPPVVPTNNGICYTPETPGTPPTVIPGTPPVGGSPGTPDIVIPGTPSIPGTPYPCP